MFQQNRKRLFQDPKKRHFAGAAAAPKPVDYPHRLNFYNTPPTAEVTLDQFEQWAIHRLFILGEIESCLFRNKSPAEMEAAIEELLKKHMPLLSNSSRPDEKTLIEQRKKDHYSHFILRLAFARSEELRKRFSRVESILFKHRFESDDSIERTEFVSSLGLNWELVDPQELAEVAEHLRNAAGPKKKEGRRKDETYFKVDWERVPSLVEQRKVFIRRGKAYVPESLQASLVVAEFTARLNADLELTARALPRLDEDERLIPILNHLSMGFTAPEYQPSSSASLTTGEAITAGSIDALSTHFPACMLHLHLTLRRNKHLKHFGRLQYTLFLKGVGLSVEESLIFWRSAFSAIAEDKFNKEYRYNVRHAYGLEGTRRNYKPHSCQQILMDHPPGTGEAHGCPYRHFSADNLNAFLMQQMGVKDQAVLKGVKADVEAKRFHLGCNRVFEYKHRDELQREKERRGTSVTETIVHPNEYFSRSWQVSHSDAAGAVGGTNAGGGDSMDVDSERRTIM